MFNLFGIGTHPSVGLRKGVVVNIESTVESIKKAVEEAELMAGCEISSVCIGIAGGHITGFNSRGIVAIKGSEISLICVGTPSQHNGSLDLKYVRAVCEEIGLALKEKDDFHVVVARSTMLPGSMRTVVIPTLEEYSGKQAGVGFGVCNNPEFLRESTAVYDYYHPPKTVIGETDARAGDRGRLGLAAGDAVGRARIDPDRLRT